MYDEQLLITHLDANTPYTIDYTGDSTIDNLDLPVPRVYVGHLGEKMQYPEDFWAEGYREIDNPRAILTSIQFICARADLHTVRNTIEAAYRTFTIDDPNVSRMSFVEGNTIVTTTDRIWYQIIVAVIMPRAGQ